MKDKLIIGSRGSKLALIQAEIAAASLHSIQPALKIEIRTIVTEGDRNQRMNIEESGNIGVFVKALEDALIEKEIDIAVHSLKDLPVALMEGLSLTAVIKREDPRDTLVANAPLNKLRAGALIGTSSIRRSVQLKQLRRDIETIGIRGNVDTRLRKVASGEIDGIIIAAAAMIRLGRKDEITEYLPIDTFIPAAGQGAVALETRSDDLFTIELSSLVNDIPTWQAISAERSFLNVMGGGCSAPITAFAEVEHGNLRLTGMVSDRDGTRMMKDTSLQVVGDSNNSGDLLARRMLASGAAELTAEIRHR